MKIKICGLTSPAEAEYLNRNHVDYAGMVLFFPKSRRNIDLAKAKEIMAALDPAIQKVAVTVSPTAEQMGMIQDAGFDIVQVHGELPGLRETAAPEFAGAHFGGQTEFAGAHSGGQRVCAGAGEREACNGEKLWIPLWKAFNVTDMDRYEEYQKDDRIRGYVFDAAVPGSGKTFDWGLVEQLPAGGKPYLLAGGLHPGNVRDAIRALRPDGVDVSSGVEKPGGGKDGALVDAFVEAARSASL